MKFQRLGAAILLLVSMNIAACTGFLSAETVFAQDMPFFEKRYETDHFVLKWTNRSVNSWDNIGDPQIIKVTAVYLEAAWAKYTALFGRHPYTPPGRDKIEVVFDYSDDAYGTAYPPDGPIHFNADAWVNNSSIRQPTSAHELFHKMQYAYGYTTRWNPREPYLWFTEGTAAWAEVFVWGRVSDASKLETLFSDTGLDLYKADYTAAPFWIYFVQRNQEHQNNQLMVKFFERCEKLGDEKLALNEVIKETYGSLDGFFNAFEGYRKNGFWSDARAIAYKRILGPDGKDIVHEVKGILRAGDKS